MKPLKPPVCPCCDEFMYLASAHLTERPNQDYVLEVTWACKKMTHKVEIKAEYRIEVELL